MKKIAIVILNFNGEDQTRACLQSIEKLDEKNFYLEVIVVDNGSKEKFKIQNSKFKIIRNEENLGFSGGNNVGIRYALEQAADYVVILNNDTLVDKNLIVELLKVADSSSEIGMVVPKIYFAKGHEFHKSRYQQKDQGKVIWYAGGVMDWNNVMGSHKGVDEVDSGQFSKIEQTEFASGCCMLIKRQVLEEVGMFDERYFLYYEDVDLSVRAKKAGYKIMFVPKALLWHINAGSTGGSGSQLQDYYTTRNRMLFGLRYAPFRSKIALFRESIRLFLSGRKWQKIGIRDFYFSRFGKGSFLI